MKLLLAANTDWYLYNFRLSLANYYRSQGAEVVLASPPGPYVPQLQQAGFRWINWPIGRQSMRPSGELRSIFRFARLLRQESPDLLNLFTIKPILYGTIAAQWAKTPAVVNFVTGRGYVFLSTDWQARLVRPLVRFLYKIFLAPPNIQLIFENEGDRDYFIQSRLIPIQRSSLIPGVGTDLERFTFTPEPEGVPAIAVVARMLWDKGIGVMIEAAQLLRSRGLPFRLILAGEPDPGNPSSIPEQVIHEWQKQEGVEYLGWQSAVENIYRQSHIVCLPSFFEGVPTTLIEGAASGRALVATDLPGCREVIQEGVNGLIVPVHDAPALADALEKLLRDPALRRQMGIAGRAAAEQKFSYQNINQQTFTVCQTAWKQRRTKKSSML